MTQRIRNISAVLLLFVSMATVFIAIIGSSSEAHGELDSIAAHGILASSRSDLSVCFENLTGNDIGNSQAFDNIQLAINSIKSHVNWKKLGYSDMNSIKIEPGCPLGYLMHDGNSHPWLTATGENPPIVKRVSEHRLWIFIVSDEIVEKHFKDSLWRKSPEEMLCQGHECAEVTTGIYITEKELLNPQSLQTAVKQGLSIEQPPRGGIGDFGLVRD